MQGVTKDTLIYLGAFALMSVIIKPVAVGCDRQSRSPDTESLAVKFGQPGKVPIVIIPDRTYGLRPAAGDTAGNQ